VDRNSADSVAAAYEAAGVHVLRRYVERHVDRAHTETMGVRGYLSYDPVYCSGLDRQEYRTAQDPWRHGQHGLGALSHQTGRGLVGGDINGMRFSGILGRQSRGYVVRTQAGLVIPEGYGQGRGRPSVLAGWRCPLPNPDTYTIEWEMRADQTPPNSQFLAKMGVLFGSADDQDTYDWAPGATYPAWVPHYYRAYVRYNGAIGIGVWRADGSFWYLRGTTESTSSTGMEIDGPNLVVNQFNAYRLTVTPTAIEFRRIRADGTTQTITATNSEYRGPYFYVEKEEEIDGTANPFRATFRSMTVNSVPGA
ncbi:MAG: hypothetical protein ACRDQ0_16310, partial [Pseudonocardia sp.]